MSLLDTCSLKKFLPLLFALFVVAQVDLASAAGWPQTLLSWLHLTPAPDDQSRGFCAGLGVVLDILVLFQLARIFAKRAMQSHHD
jgi:hypothetical protein